MPDEFPDFQQGITFYSANVFLAKTHVNVFFGIILETKKKM